MSSRAYRTPSPYLDRQAASRAEAVADSSIRTKDTRIYGELWVGLALRHLVCGRRRRRELSTAALGSMADWDDVKESDYGYIHRVSGPLVIAEKMSGAAMRARSATPSLFRREKRAVPFTPRRS